MRLTKVLVANRGEIAVRVIRACRDAGLRAVAVYSDADRDALHVRLADEAYPIGPAPATESYLLGDKLIAVARRAGCDAVHPGYGFLSEDAGFAEAVTVAGLVFVGPPAEVQRRLGDKAAARRLARDVGVPVATGTFEPVGDLAAARSAANEVGYPVILKPAGGGGGKGMRIVATAAGLAEAWRGATGEAQGVLGAPAALVVERYIGAARHIEVQLVADDHGAIVPLGERDCSIQRRYQKLIEETPGPSVDATLRERLFDAAVKVARAAGYRNAGTVEFLVEPDGSFVFLEVNTRLQVEHPITELVTGLDLVLLQLRLAAGEPLPFAQADVRASGAAIECRITAEDPFSGFLPAAGIIAAVREPSGPGVRLDGALVPGMLVATEYDPLLAKLVTWGVDRPAALAHMRRALGEMIVAGIPTTLPFHRATLAESDFVAGRYDTGYIAAHWPREAELGEGATIAAAIIAVLASRSSFLMTPATGTDVAATGAWARAARLDGLR
ncbi:MAG: biotin carboxylase N-terminal domain-containing protein [Candidatus Limnocylindria bacterium]|nr:biotin carboxylase N-terminal domain-containing protein [Candidatus Limnocylindria bacterium]